MTDFGQPFWHYYLIESHSETIRASGQPCSQIYGFFWRHQSISTMIDCSWSQIFLTYCFRWSQPTCCSPYRYRYHHHHQSTVARAFGACVPELPPGFTSLLFCAKRWREQLFGLTYIEWIAWSANRASMLRFSRRSQSHDRMSCRCSSRTVPHLIW